MKETEKAQSLENVVFSRLCADEPSMFYGGDKRDRTADLLNAIYASYRSASILTGRVVGVDTTVLTLNNPKTGEPEQKEINCLVVIGYRVKVLIPEQEIW